MQVIFSERFEDELVEIADFIAFYSERRADLFVDEVRARCQNLADSPYICRKSLKIDDKNARDLIFKGYVIPYFIEDSRIHILGIYKANSWEL